MCKINIIDIKTHGRLWLDVSLESEGLRLKDSAVYPSLGRHSSFLPFLRPSDLGLFNYWIVTHLFRLFCRLVRRPLLDTRPLCRPSSLRFFPSLSSARSRPLVPHPSRVSKSFQVPSRPRWSGCFGDVGGWTQFLGPGTIGIYYGKEKKVVGKVVSEIRNCTILVRVTF